LSAEIFLFKILILPPLGLCCPGHSHHSPQPSYAPVFVNHPVLSCSYRCMDWWFKRS